MKSISPRVALFLGRISKAKEVKIICYSDIWQSIVRGISIDESNYFENERDWPYIARALRILEFIQNN